jgi:hypothetical protein
MNRTLVLVTTILALASVSYHGMFSMHPNVVAFRNGTSKVRGSGVVIADGWILTAGHVLPIKTANDMPCGEAIKHPTMDLALVPCPGVRAYGLRLAQRRPSVYDRLYAYGWHQGEKLLRTEGYQGHLLGTASTPVINGCSGGAIVNDRGELIGIVKTVAYRLTASGKDAYAVVHMAGYTPIDFDALDWILLHTK